MDPCCGSGHFLVEAFSMLWQMRAEEEGLAPVEAQDAVLRDNLFGLELDPRCVQIAMFAVALQAWKAGGGWRQLPVPNIACSGIPVKAPVEEWKALAGGDQRLENALVRLHILFRDADTLGSLIDPKRATEISGSQRAAAHRSRRRLGRGRAAARDGASRRELTIPAYGVLGATLLASREQPSCSSRRYTLVATNVPYLGRGSRARAHELHRRVRSAALQGGPGDRVPASAVCGLLAQAGTSLRVTPQNWLFLRRIDDFRDSLLRAAAH